MDKIRETLEEWVKEYPVILPLFCIVLGILLLLACILDWNWIFGDISGSNYDPRKIDGLVNMFGRKTARFLVSILSIFLIVIGVLTFMILYDM
ncbi:MAG: immunity 17 family protein [Prevotella sp.]|jgi:hypothetical protein|nr:immunity 17 family protein [Prevotella sp.]